MRLGLQKGADGGEGCLERGEVGVGEHIDGQRDARGHGELEIGLERSGGRVCDGLQGRAGVSGFREGPVVKMGQ